MSLWGEDDDYTEYKKGNGARNPNLRDQLAMAALPYSLGRDYGNDWGKDGKEHKERASRHAYSIADAMLAAREAK